jgi:hypothetical protein
VKVTKKLDFLYWRIYEHSVCDAVECKTLFGFRFYRRVGKIVNWFGLFTYVKECE